MNNQDKNENRLNYFPIYSPHWMIKLLDIRFPLFKWRLSTTHFSTREFVNLDIPQGVGKWGLGQSLGDHGSRSHNLRHICYKMWAFSEATGIRPAPCLSSSPTGRTEDVHESLIYDFMCNFCCFEVLGIASHDFFVAYLKGSDASLDNRANGPGAEGSPSSGCRAPQPQDLSSPSPWCQLVPDAARRCQLLPAYMLPVAARCFQMLPDAPRCCQIIPGTTDDLRCCQLRCCQMLLHAPRSCQMLRDTARCWLMLPIPTPMPTPTPTQMLIQMPKPITMPTPTPIPNANTNTNINADTNTKTDTNTNI